MFIRNYFSVRTIERALLYGVFNRAAIERMVSQIITVDLGLSCEDITDDYQKRHSFREGLYTEENNINYDQPSEMA